MTLHGVIKMFVLCCELFEQRKVDDTQQVYMKINNKLYEVNHMYFDDDRNLIIGNMNLE
jgi:hypothetical protein